MFLFAIEVFIYDKTLPNDIFIQNKIFNNIVVMIVVVVVGVVVIDVIIVRDILAWREIFDKYRINHYFLGSSVVIGKDLACICLNRQKRKLFDYYI